MQIYHSPLNYGILHYLLYKTSFLEEGDIDLTAHPCQSPDHMKADHPPDDPHEGQHIYIVEEVDQPLVQIRIQPEILMKRRREQQVKGYGNEADGN
jgi:hypothetical protein